MNDRLKLYIIFGQVLFCRGASVLFFMIDQNDFAAHKSKWVICSCLILHPQKTEPQMLREEGKKDELKLLVGRFGPKDLLFETSRKMCVCMEQEKMN